MPKKQPEPELTNACGGIYGGTFKTTTKYNQYKTMNYDILFIPAGTPNTLLLKSTEINKIPLYSVISS